MSLSDTLTPRGSGEVKFGFWATMRPLTRKWGSGQVWDRIVKHLGQPEVAFGKTDGIPPGILAIDRRTGYEWAELPFEDNQFSFGYWDPPYNHLYKHEGMEIWRTTRRLAILHTHVWPRAWLEKVSGPATREAMIAVTMGPMKATRCLQVWRKTEARV